MKKIVLLFAVICLVMFCKKADAQYITSRHDTVNCSGDATLELDIPSTTSSDSLSVVTDFGDGTFNVDSNITGSVFSSHQYGSPGIFTVKQTVFDTTGSAVDSVLFAISNFPCNVLSVKYYIDINGNCVKDINEPYLVLPVLIEVDSNGISVGVFSLTSGFYYRAYGNPGDVYTFKTLSSSLPAGLAFTCPASGIVLDTLQSVTSSLPAKLIGLQCTSSNSFDLSENAIVPVTGVNDEKGYVYVQNASCEFINATVTVHYSKKYYFNGMSGNPTPASYTDSTIIWSINGLTNNAIAPVTLCYVVSANPATGLLTIGDTVHSYYTITPTVGDADTSNNSEIIIDTVMDDCDPNEMTVKPSGYISAGTQLQYTINFENTGNDTAFNIHVMDTLSDNVDANSLQVIMASAAMNIAPFTANGHNIVKFDFPGINLLDSTHSVLCNGAVVFSISTKSGLADGSTIFNHAGVYFDANPVVTTDTVEDIIGIPANVPAVTNSSNVEIYPNPANDVLTIKIEKGQYNSFTIVNNVGEVVTKQPLNNYQTNVDVKALPAGMYYISLKGDSGVVVRKFVKL